MIRTMLRPLFLLIAAIIRVLPRIRGKVRVGQVVYRMANPRKTSFAVTTTLFPERLRFRLNLTSAHERMAFLMNGYESETVALLDRLYQGGTILDIGANIGLIAIPLAVRTAGRAAHSPHVIAFEALPSNHDALTWNVQANHLEGSIRPLSIALGAERKQVKIQIEGEDPTRTGTANILPTTFHFNEIDLEIHPLDALIDAGTIPGPRSRS